MKKRILIADNQFLSRKGLLAFLASLKLYNFQEVLSGTELLENGKNCELLIIDYSVPPFYLQQIHELKVQNPLLRILAITSTVSKAGVSEAIKSGIDSHLLKECDPDEIAEAIEKTFVGEKFFCGKILGEILNEPAPAIPPANNCTGHNITEREIEIIALIAEGFSNKQIAEILFLSTHTVNTHRKNIMNKLGINNSAGLIMFALRENLISPNKFLFSSPNS